MTIAAQRAVIGTALSTITGLNVDEYMTDTINPPQAMIDLHPDYDLVFSGTKDTYNYLVHVYSQRTNEKSSQLLLDTLRDPNDAGSVKQVLDAIPPSATLDYVWVKNCSPVEVVQVGVPEFLRITFEVEVVA